MLSDFQKDFLLSFDEPYLKRLGARIAKKRKQLNMTQRRLSEETMLLPHSSISKIEKGLVDISVTTLVKIAFALNCSLLYLLQGSEL